MRVRERECLSLHFFWSNILSAELECYGRKAKLRWEYLATVVMFALSSEVSWRLICWLCAWSTWESDGWALFCFPSLLPRCGKSAKQLFDTELDHRDHVFGGAARPHCAPGLLRAAKHRRQVCRYAAAPATGNVLHGKRSVGLWPFSPQSGSKLTFLHDFDWLAESLGAQLWPCMCTLTTDAGCSDHQPSPLAASLHFLHVPIYPPPHLLITDSGVPIRNVHMHISLFPTTNVSLLPTPGAGLLLLLCPVLPKQSELFVCSLRRLLRDHSVGAFIRLRKINQKKKISSTSSAVKEREDLHPDVESQEMNDDTFCEYRWAPVLLGRGTPFLQHLLNKWCTYI